MGSKHWIKAPLSLFTGLVVFFLGTSLALTANLSLDDRSAGVGETVTFTVTIEDAPNSVAAMAFDITFDNDVLTYTGFDPEELSGDFLLFHVSNPRPGILRVAGITTNPIVAGASGNLVRLNFTVAAPKTSDLTFQNLKDDIAKWTTKDGSF